VTGVQTCALPISPETLAAFPAANLGTAASYGNDDWTRRAKDLLRGVFETDCEISFVYNGTAANALALSALCRSYHSVICQQYSHVDTDECGAPEFFTGGAKVIPIASAHGKLRPADVEQAARRLGEVHYPKAGALSLTQSTEWATVYTPGEIGTLCATAKELGLAVQMDGARFANAAATLAAR